MAKDIADMLADGELTTFEAAGQLALAHSMQKRLKTQIDALKEFLTDRMDSREHLTTDLGTVTAKRGSEPRWRVKDPVAFAQWLKEHGEEESVEQVPYPKEFAAKPDAIEHLVGQFGGEQPAGVELSRGSGDTVAVSRVKDWAQIFDDQKAQAQARQLLGITSGLGEIKDDADEEENPWDRI
ncbi:hypothetical protein J3T91_05545 [Bifidobacterium sp. B4001]|uniref:hypothetical protein n=1 Tax=unclassified Bifidobacterium TaxID=2608897 RepID=UPI00226B5E39|nr:MULTISPECIES: hypothetical protein [unclassified Bifidobacterium]MCX8672976.1 hypothetical protein [Bifidobacterium sp. B4079]MCX8681409.1 hypothetical protein [Bifidobacterium sp. B4001]